MPCTPGMRRCKLDCLHRRMVTNYHAARQAYDEALEAATALYPAEVAEYKRVNPGITFREWLEGNRGAA